MRAYELRIREINYTLKVLERLIKENEKEIKSYSEDIDNIRFSNWREYFPKSEREAIEPTWRKMDKNEFMLFHLKNEYKKLEKILIELESIE